MYVPTCVADNWEIEYIVIEEVLGQCTMTGLSAGGVDYVDGNTEETVEGLLAYRGRSQASCICTTSSG